MQWTSELYHYESPPPEGSWDRISFELDNDISGLRKNLREIEEIPPPAVWTSVQKELDSAYTSNVIRLPWYRRASRWAAAAAIAGILFFAAWMVNSPKYFTPSDIASSIVPAESSAMVSNKQKPAEIIITPPPVSVPSEKSVKADESALSAEPPEYVNVPVYPAAKENKRSSNTAYASIDAEIKPGEIKLPQNIHDKRDYRLMKSIQFHDGNYIQIVSAEGNTTRVSYKLQEMIPAIRNDVDNPILNQWKSRLQSSAFVPASVNFFDIADMVGMLSDQH